MRKPIPKCENCDNELSYSRLTMNDVYHERISEINKEFQEDKDFRFRITEKTRPREIVHLMSRCLEQLGVTIEMHEVQDDRFVLSGLPYREMDVRITQLSDHQLHRLLEERSRTEERERKKKKEDKAIVAGSANRILDGINKDVFNDMRGLKSTEKKKKTKKVEKKKNKKVKTSMSVFKYHRRKLVKKENGKLNWSEGKSFEEAKEKKNTTEYQEKIKWFCEKYKEDYDIIYESLKDDDLNNFSWKGEKINFPKL